MAINALRFRQQIQETELTKAGFLVYSGDAFHYHEWEFRTMTKYEATKADERWALGAKVVESLRGDAYTVAEDMGTGALKKDDAVLQLIEHMKKAVFPLKEHEAKELYRIGTSVGGPLARQPGESMAHYISRRKRWWKKLRELDDKVDVSETILTDLLLDNAGLSRHEKLMILTATHENPTFETASEALIRQHGRVHINEHRNGSRPTSPRDR